MAVMERFGGDAGAGAAPDVAWAGAGAEDEAGAAPAAGGFGVPAVGVAIFRRAEVVNLSGVDAEKKMQPKNLPASHFCHLLIGGGLPWSTGRGGDAERWKEKMSRISTLCSTT